MYVCHKPQQLGFTLVELSIVLVIIGLLIGGILVGQSLVNATKMQSFIRQLAQYDVAVGNFKTKYKSIPGDSRLFGGNGDNEVIAAEQDNFFYNLSIIGLKRPEGGSYGNTNTYAPSVTYPASALNKKTIVLPLRGMWIITPYTAGENYYMVGTWVGYTTNGGQGTATYEEALSFDAKLDDNNFNTGKVRAWGPFSDSSYYLIQRMGLQTGELY